MCKYSDLLADMLTPYQKRYCVVYINVKSLKGREDLLALSLDEYLSYKYGFYFFYLSLLLSFAFIVPVSLGNRGKASTEFLTSAGLSTILPCIFICWPCGAL